MPHKVDIQVGANLRALRKALMMSQGALASKLGLTFQQVQKYERGANRISASKLYEVAEILGVRVESLFEGLAEIPPHSDALHSQTCPSKSDLQRLVDAFESLPEDRKGWLVQTAEIAMGDRTKR